jgi:hypothetical protein
MVLSLSNSVIAQQKISTKSFCGHPVKLDADNKLLPWFSPQDKAYDHFLRLRWDFIRNKVPNAPGPAPRSNYPQYYFYASFKPAGDSIIPDLWMNDVAEKIPNWFESARLFYAYSGDESVMKIVKDFMDYVLAHGTSSAKDAWPNFPYTTTNPGDTIFRGFTASSRFALHEIQVDHAGDMGYAYYRMYKYSGEKKYLDAALNVANVLAKHARKGNAEQSVWPYRVLLTTGKITAEYGANWAGSYMLMATLVNDGVGDVNAYKKARDLAKEFLLEFPVKTGYWTDGHTDTKINSPKYKSNMSASNFKLCSFDFPELNPYWKANIPELIRWTEENFIYRRAPLNSSDLWDAGLTDAEANGIPLEPARLWGANIVGEQDSFICKMDYQTARYAAECARWCGATGDASYKDKAFRSLNFVTYCNTNDGMALESPFSAGVNSWWSDCYGEGPRMFYQAFAGIPEFAPSAENHILYSEGVLINILYGKQNVQYTATKNDDREYLRLAFKPSTITLNGKKLPLVNNLKNDGYTIKNLGNGDYAVTIKRLRAGDVIVKL